VDLYCKKVSLSPLWILHYPKANILVIECFIFLYRLPKLVELSSVAILLYWLSKLVNLSNVVVVYIFYYSNLYHIGIVTAVAVSSLIGILVGGVVIILEEVAVIIVKTIASVALIVVISVYCFLKGFTLVGIFRFAKGVFASFAL
jgi:hypothetical protein